MRLQHFGLDILSLPDIMGICSKHVKHNYKNFYENKNHRPVQKQRFNADSLYRRSEEYLNNNRNFIMKPIGTIRTPHVNMEGTPVQPRWAKGTHGTIEIDDEYAPGLLDLDGFSHIIVLYVFDRITDVLHLTPVPFLDTKPHGIFATRSPWRPNHIGLSVLAIVSINGNTIEVEGVDMLDGTPVLDIKPHVPDFEPDGEIKIGWLDGKTDIPDARAGADKCDR